MAERTAARSVYIAGPMAGVEEFNYPLFNAVAELLRGLDFKVVNPAELDGTDGWPEATPTDDHYVAPVERAGFMRRDLPHVLECDAIALLPDWETSTGANIELLVALAAGKEVWEFFEDEEVGLALAYSAARPDLFRIVKHIEEVHDGRVGPE